MLDYFFLSFFFFFFFLLFFRLTHTGMLVGRFIDVFLRCYDNVAAPHIVHGGLETAQANQRCMNMSSGCVWPPGAQRTRLGWVGARPPFLSWWICWGVFMGRIPPPPLQSLSLVLVVEGAKA